MLRRLRKFRALTGPQRATLLRALLMTPVVSIALKIWGLAKVHEFLEQRAARRPGRPAGGEEEAMEEALVAGRLANIAARRGIWKANCLQRSLVLWWLLRRKGIDTELRIGCRFEEPEPLFHAWLERDGTVLNDGADIRQRYTPFETVIAPPGSRFD